MFPAPLKSVDAKLKAVNYKVLLSVRSTEKYFVYNTISVVMALILCHSTDEIFRHLLGITKLDKEKNQCIRQNTGPQNIVKEIKQYQEKWLQHVQRMDIERLPKKALQYKPKRRRNIGRPRKRWRDQLHLEDQGTGNMPNPSGT